MLRALQTVGLQEKGRGGGGDVQKRVGATKCLAGGRVQFMWRNGPGSQAQLLGSMRLRVA